MRKLNKTILLMSSMMIFMNGCKEIEVPYFTGESSANFWEHVRNHSLFGATTQQLPQDTVVFDVALIGPTANVDRNIKVVAREDAAGTSLADKLTTATPDQYEILGGVIPAKAQHGKVKVVVKNVAALAVEKSDLKLRLEIVPNENFGQGLKENYYLNLKWSRDILQPSTWNAMRFFFTAVYSTQVYKVFMEVTGLKEFYYYQGVISEAEGRVMGKKFADRVRELSAQQGSPLLHDDGANKGLPIVPIY